LFGIHNTPTPTLTTTTTTTSTSTSTTTLNEHTKHQMHKHTSSQYHNIINF
jgi:hypothetical protein